VKMMENLRVVVTKTGGPEVLQLVKEPIPEPAPNEVRIAKIGQPIRGRLDTFGRFGLIMALSKLRGGQATFYGIMFMKKAHPDWFNADLAELFNLYLQGKIDPIVAKVLPLAEASQALAMLESRQVSGKIVLDCTA
jgi:NADPH:quinone reductase-like Zn-dependent oxidoreductase